MKKMPKIPPGMYQCKRCEWVYPAEYVNMMRTNLPDLDGKAFCGICALDITNSIHGVKREKFDGAGAELMRQMAIDWRKKHSYNDPAKRRK
jgi:hypothetical protein